MSVFFNILELNATVMINFVTNLEKFKKIICLLIYLYFRRCHDIINRLLVLKRSPVLFRNCSCDPCRSFSTILIPSSHSLFLGNCAKNDCHHNATCTVTDSSYFCNCTKGFQGNGTHCTGISFFTAFYSSLFGV